jgi:hypothetical protein
MDLSHLYESVPIDTAVSEDRHPAIAVGAHVAKLDAAQHPVARIAAEKAIDATTTAYKSHLSLANDLKVLEGYTRSKIPVGAEEQNAAIAKFTRLASAAVTKGIQASDKAEAELAKSEEQLQKQIKAAITDPLITPDVAREIRQHLKSLGPKGADDFLRSSVSAGNLDALTAVMATPAFLANVDDAKLKLYAQMAAEQHAHDFVVQLSAVSAMKQTVKANRESLQSKWQAAQKVAKPRTVNVFSSGEA